MSNVAASPMPGGTESTVAGSVTTAAAHAGPSAPGNVGASAQIAHLGVARLRDLLGVVAGAVDAAALRGSRSQPP